MKKIFSVLRKIFLIIVVIVAVLVGIEIYLNLSHFKRFPDSWDLGYGKTSMFQLDKTRIFRQTVFYPGTDHYKFRYNPRNSELNISGQTKKIFMTGDDFTWGVNTEDPAKTYPYLTESELLKQTEKVAVYNAATPYYSPDQVFLYIKDELIPKYHPNVIVWNFTTDDLWGMNYGCLFKNQNGVYKQVPAAYNFLYLKNYFLGRTPKYVLYSNLVNIVSHNIVWKINQSDLELRHTFGCTGKFNGREDEIGLKLKYFLNEMERITQKENIKMIVTLLPYSYYFNPNISNDALLAKYKVLVKYLSSSDSIQFINFNDEIAKEMDMNLWNYRQGKTNTSIKEIADFNSLFFNGPATGGDRQLSVQSNERMAKIISNYLK